MGLQASRPSLKDMSHGRIAAQAPAPVLRPECSPLTLYPITDVMDVWCRFEYKQEKRLLGWQIDNRIYRRLIHPLIGADAGRALWAVFCERRAASELYITSYDLSVRTSPIKAAAAAAAPPTAASLSPSATTSAAPTTAPDSTSNGADQSFVIHESDSAAANATAHAIASATANATCDVLVLISAMILCCRGTVQQKITALVDVFNFSATDSILPAEMSVLIRAVMCAFATACNMDAVSMIGRHHRTLLESAYRDARSSFLKSVGSSLSRREVMEWCLHTPDVRLLLSLPIFGTTNSDIIRTKYSAATAPAAYTVKAPEQSGPATVSVASISARRGSTSGAIGAGSTFFAAASPPPAAAAATARGSQTARHPRDETKKPEKPAAAARARMTATTIRMTGGPIGGGSVKSGGLQQPLNEHSFKFSMKNTRREVREIKALFDYIDFERVGYVPTAVFTYDANAAGLQSPNANANANPNATPTATAAAAGARSTPASQQQSSPPAYQRPHHHAYQPSLVTAAVAAAATDEPDDSNTNSRSQLSSPPDLDSMAARVKFHRPISASVQPKAAPVPAAAPVPEEPITSASSHPVLRSIAASMNAALGRVQPPPPPQPAPSLHHRVPSATSHPHSLLLRPHAPNSLLRPESAHSRSTSPAPPQQPVASPRFDPASLMHSPAATPIRSPAPPSHQPLSSSAKRAESSGQAMTYVGRTPEQVRQLSFVLPLLSKHHITNHTGNSSYNALVAGVPTRSGIDPRDQQHYERSETAPSSRTTPLRTARVVQTHFVRSTRGASLSTVAADTARQIALDIPTVIGGRKRRTPARARPAPAAAPSTLAAAAAADSHTAAIAAAPNGSASYRVRYSELEEERANAEKERKRKEKERLIREQLYKRICYVFQHHIKTRGNGMGVTPAADGNSADPNSGGGGGGGGGPLASPVGSGPLQSPHSITSNNRPSTASGGTTGRAILPFRTAIPGRLTFPELLLDVLYCDVSSHERERLQQWIQQPPSKPVVKSIQRIFDRVDAVGGFTGRVVLHHVLHALKLSVHKPLVEAFQQFRIQPDPNGFVDFHTLLGYLFNHRSHADKFKKKIAKWAKPSKLLTRQQQDELKQIFETFVYADRTAAAVTANAEAAAAAAATASAPLSSTLLRFSTSVNGRKVYHPLSHGTGIVSAISSGVGTGLVDPTEEEKRTILVPDAIQIATHVHTGGAAGATSATPAHFPLSPPPPASVDVMHCSRLVEFLEKRYGMASDEIKELLKESGLRANEYITLQEFQLFFRNSWDLFSNYYP